MTNVAFIAGSPRSGTTLLGRVLDLHPQIAQWYEPVFVTDYRSQHYRDDRRTAADATPDITRYIQNQFGYFQQKSGCPLVIDKNPLNSFKIPFLRAIFPEAKIIHMLRDGRDTTLSIRVEWDTRVAMLTSPQQHIDAIRKFFDFLSRQPLLRHKIESALFEIQNPFNLLRGRLHASYRARRWYGRPGWGPRFPGWENVIDEIPSLAFNAMQWVECVKALQQDTQNLDNSNFLEVRYESFTHQPADELKRIFDFLDLPMPPDLMSNMLTINADNTEKWRNGFTEEEKHLIEPILSPLLIELGYADYSDWAKVGV